MVNKRILLSAMAGMLAVNLRSNAIPDTFSVPYPDAPQKKGATRKVGVSKQKRAKKKRKNKRKQR